MVIITESGSNDGKGPGRGVPNVLVNVVYVGPHGGDHGSEAGRLGQVADDLATLHSRVVVLVNQQRFYHHQDLGCELNFWILQQKDILI